MLQAENVGMQRLPFKASECLPCTIIEPRSLGFEAGSVSVVTQKRMADMREMNPDLVSTTGLETECKEARDRVAGRAVGLDQPPARDGAPAVAPHAHPFPGVRVTPDRGIDGTDRLVRQAPDEAEVFALERTGAAVIGELCRERPMSGFGLGDDQQARRVLVEPMHNAGPAHSPDSRKVVTAMGDERVDKRAGPVAGSRMDDEACRLVDHDQIRILVDDLERNGFRRWCRVFGRRHVDREHRARVDALTGIADGAAVNLDLAGENERFDARP